MDMPVTGISESALLTAWTLGRRFSIVCMTARLRTWYAECVVEHGLAARLASVRALDVPVSDITRARDTLADPMLAPGICVGYRFGRAPELFVSDSPLMGSMFTNDVMRIKVRFIYTIGIGEYRAFYGAVVA